MQLNAACDKYYKTFSKKLKPNEIINEKNLNINKFFSQRKLRKLLK